VVVGVSLWDNWSSRCQGGCALLPQSSVAGFVEAEEVTDCCTWWMLLLYLLVENEYCSQWLVPVVTVIVGKGSCCWVSG